MVRDNLPRLAYYKHRCNYFRGQEVVYSLSRSDFMRTDLENKMDKCKIIERRIGKISSCKVSIGILNLQIYLASARYLRFFLTSIYRKAVFK